jgi:hypothetical protein
VWRFQANGDPTQDARASGVDMFNSNSLTQQSGLSNVAAVSSRARVVLLRDGTLLEGQYDSTPEKQVFTAPYLPRQAREEKAPGSR